MRHLISIAGSLMAILYMLPFPATAQDAPPAYIADPSVYKVILENKDFRVILGTWAPGVHDKSHSHLLPYVYYDVTGCSVRIYTPDGKTREAHSKAGDLHEGKFVSSHSTENIGTTECQALFIERK